MDDLPVRLLQWRERLARGVFNRSRDLRVTLSREEFVASHVAHRLRLLRGRVQLQNFSRNKSIGIYIAIIHVWYHVGQIVPCVYPTKFADEHYQP